MKLCSSLSNGTSDRVGLLLQSSQRRLVVTAYTSGVVDLFFGTAAQRMLGPVTCSDYPIAT